MDEIVRYASPVVFMRRTATQRLEIGGQEFEEGDKFVLFYGAANRDPRVFEDPERFDVRRNPNPHVGFGGPGPHFCLGAHLARRELGIVFRQLFERVPDIHPVGEPEYLVATFGPPLVSGVKHLKVGFTPTAPVGALSRIRPSGSPTGRRGRRAIWAERLAIAMNMASPRSVRPTTIEAKTAITRLE